MTRVLHGSCLCGATLYNVADDFKYALICHCSQCRRATGSAFKPFGGIERFHLKVKKGRLKIYGDVVRHNANCITCGSLLYSIIEKMAHVTYGTLLDAPTLQPQAHIFVGSKATWDVICDSLPQHMEFPPKG
ncbi:MAG TPA: GFA family protein [Vicinamibacterales bacterium]|nr:GFA family protein [Vicinamibacterales bacterium]